ncbi:MAG TPA: iron ABC transporter permease [Acidimicrobiales bacterium]|nr:iron ABC transporter permease [Acidimicrobiales bacterium]
MLALRLRRLDWRSSLQLGALLTAVGYLVVWPMFRLVQEATRNGNQAATDARHIAGLGEVIWTTVELAIGSVVISLVLGVALALVATRLPRRWAWMGMLPVLPLVIPAVANVVGWALLLSPKVGYLNAFIRAVLGMDPNGSGPIDIYSKPWIIIITGFALTSFMYVFIRSGLANMNAELLEAGAVFGSTPSRVLRTVTLPLLRPVILYGSGITLLLALGQFTAPLLLGPQENIRVLTTVIYDRTANPPIDYGVAAVLATPLLLAGLVIVGLQRLSLRDEGRYVTQGGRASRSSLRPTAWSIVPVTVYAIVALGLPLFGLTVVALSPFYSRHIQTDKFTFANFTQVFHDPQLSGAIRNSLVLAVGGVLIVLLVGYLVAELMRREDTPALLRRTLEFITFLPLGVPAVVFGAGFLFAYTRGPFVLYGTNFVILLVYITLMLPYATRFVISSRSALGTVFEESARVAGASRLRCHLTIVLPLVRAALGGAAALMFVLLTHEFSASLLVRSTRTNVMGTVLFDLWTSTSYPIVAAMALVMCVIAAVGVALAFAVGGGRRMAENL